ncbi:MAG: amidohydrolase family protein [bacterium]
MSAEADQGRVAGTILPGPGEAAYPGRLEWRDGRITALVRDSESAPAGPVIAPGLIDSHTHPVELGLEGIFPDLSPAGDIAGVLDRLGAGLDRGREAGVLLGLNIDPDRLSERRLPTRAELDALAADLPAVAYRVDRHSAALNAAALRLAGLDPAGAGVVAGPEYERAARVFARILPAATVAAALEHAAALAARAGTTTVGALDGTEDFTAEDWESLVAAMGRLPVRFVPFLQTLDPGHAARLGLPRVGGCILVDGSLGSHTAALEEDYADRPGARGVLYRDEAGLARFLAEADRLGLQTALHAIGDRAVGTALRAHARAGTRPELRHRIEHAELLSAGLIAGIARAGIVLGVQPAFEAAWGGPDRLYARRLGPRWRKTNPFRSLLAAGVRLAGGSDAPITPIDPLAGIRAALEHPNPDERVGPDDALAMFTTAAAHSLGLEGETGRLAPGLAADLVVLSADPRAPACRVFETWCRGRRVFAAGAGSR